MYEMSFLKILRFYGNLILISATTTKLSFEEKNKYNKVRNSVKITSKNKRSLKLPLPFGNFEDAADASSAPSAVLNNATCAEGFINLKIDMLTASMQYTPFTWSIKNLNTNEVAMNGGPYEGSSLSYIFSECLDKNDAYELVAFENVDWFGRQGYFKFFVNNILFQEREGDWNYPYMRVIVCSSDDDCDDHNPYSKGTCNTNTKKCTYTANEFSAESRTTGTPKALALRFIANDAEPTFSESELNEQIFGTRTGTVSVASQFCACSADKFTIKPFIGTTTTGISIENGVTEISLNQDVVGEKIGSVFAAASSKAAEILGNLESQFDFILFCIPPGTILGSSSNWKAYAYVHHHLSIYNNENCIYLSVLMHEIGHNIGLSHSHDELSYGDETGMMGISYSQVNGPLKCYNGAKSWQLGWYHDSHAVINMKENSVNGYYNIVGISDYNIRRDKFTIVKMTNTGDGYDYYFSFNRMTNANLGAVEGVDEVLVVKRPVGSDFEDSTLISRIPDNGAITIFYVERNADVTVLVYLYPEDSVVYATLQVYETNMNERQCEVDEECNDLNSCTEDNCSNQNYCSFNPLPCHDCGKNVQVKITTNEFPQHLDWNIRNIETERVLLASGLYSLPNQDYTHDDCLPHGKYIFSFSYGTNLTSAGSVDFDLFIGDYLMDNGTISEYYYFESYFIICSSDLECQDFDGCTIDYCDVERKICNNTLLDDQDCLNCSWFTMNITTDNYPEETNWGVYLADDEESNFFVMSGNPFAFDSSSAFGAGKNGRVLFSCLFSCIFRFHILTAGRRKAPTKAGRRKAPTKRGRRKAPTRSSSITDTSYRKLIENVVISEVSCLEHNQLYSFIITDSFGDGICCTEGDGSYSLTVNDNILAEGGMFADEEEIIFSLQDCLSDADCLSLDACTTGTCQPGISACVYFRNPCEICGAMVTVSIKTGFWPGKIQWKIESDSRKIMNGDHYASPYTPYEQADCLLVGSYVFTLFGFAYSCAENSHNLDANPCWIKVNDNVLANVNDLMEDVHFEICLSDADCDDGDPCTNDVCSGSFCVHDDSICSNTSENPAAYTPTTPYPTQYKPNTLSPTLSVMLPTTKPSLSPSIIFTPSTKPSLAGTPLSDWMLKFDKAFMTDNSKDMLKGGLTIQYQMSKGKLVEQFAPRLYHKKCLLPLNDSTVAIQNKSIVIDDTSDMDIGRVALVFNSSNLRESTVWTSTSSDSGTIAFCIRTELLFEEDGVGTALAYADTVVASEVKFDTGFATAEQFSLTKHDVSEVTKYGQMKITACICHTPTPQTVECEENPTFIQNMIVKLCVFPPASMQIVSFDNVIMFQDGIAKFIAIENGITKLATRTTTIDNVGVMKTYVLATFFEMPTPSDVRITGAVMLDFLSGRLLSESDSYMEGGSQQAEFELTVKPTKNSKFMIRRMIGAVFLALFALVIFKKYRHKSKGYIVLNNQE